MNNLLFNLYLKIKNKTATRKTTANSLPLFFGRETLYLLLLARRLKWSKLGVYRYAILI